MPIDDSEGEACLCLSFLMGHLLRGRSVASLLGDLSIFFLGFALWLLYWHFLGYPLIMLALGRRRKTPPPPALVPSVTVVIPVYNEVNNIASRVANLFAQDYPKGQMDVVIVESGSTDGTLAAANELAARTPGVRVVDQGARLGKASAVAAGKAITNSDIIVVSDANTVYEQATLRELVHPFSDPTVGGVGGRFVPRNAGDARAAGSNFYWSLEEIMRSGEAALDSCCTFHGEVYAWRRELVEPDRTAIIDDFDSAIQIRRKGYRVAYAPKAVAYEAAPTEMREMATQWRKNALGAIQCGFRNLGFLVGHPSYYTWVIFPSHKGLQVIQPFLLAIAAVALLGSLLSGAYLEVGVLVVVFAVMTSASAFALYRHVLQGAHSESGPILGGASWLRTFLAFQAAVLLAWKDYLSGHHDVRWKKVESTRL